VEGLESERCQREFGYRMIGLQLPVRADGALQVLCLGAHSDDIEIGCGGFILRLAEQYPGCRFHWAVFSAADVREQEARRAAQLFATGRGGDTPTIKNFQDGFLPYVGANVKTVFEDLKRSVAPDVILTHNGKDGHQDHRLISELTWNTFRDHFILEYEVPKYDGDLGQPTVFVPLSEEICQRKARHIMEAFPSQRGKRWFQTDLFLSLMRLRGMECNSFSGYAEAFYCRKLVL
jgi:LmbE family N-acetylglucosaminyl deacetylase